LLAVLRQRNFAIFSGGAFVSSIGDWVLFIALPFYIYQLTGSVLATSITFMAETAPGLLIGPFAGVLVDRWDRRRAKLLADVARGLLVAALALVQSPDMVWLVYVIAFAEASVSQFAMPAVSALVPRLVAPELLGRANSASAVRAQVSQLIGFPLGGALMAIGGLPLVVTVDVASYLTSAVAMALLQPPTKGGFRTGGIDRPPTGVLQGIWRDWKEGLAAVRASRTLSGLLIVVVIAVFAQSLITPLFVPLVKDVLGGGALEFGWLAASQAVGGIVGGILIGQFWPHARRGAVVLGQIGVGVLAALLVNVPVLWLAYAVIALLGIPSIAANVAMQTMLQESAADYVRGRVFATVGTVQSICLLLGMSSAGVVADRFGTRIPFEIAAALFVLAGVSAAVLVQRDPGSPHQVG
jgi:MFS family permease